MTKVSIIVSTDYPPNYAEIEKTFDLRNLTPIFAFSPLVYNPHNTKIPGELVAHEAVHINRQGSDPAGWWKRYLADENFRLAEEILAHVAEYRRLCDDAKTRAQRRQVMHYVAARLRAPIYGYKPSLPYDRAKQFLKMALHAGNRDEVPLRSQQFNPNTDDI